MVEFGSPRFAARLLAAFSAGSGLAALGVSVLAGSGVSGVQVGLARASGVVAVAIGVAIWAIPWNRLGLRSTLAALLPCYAFMTIAASLAGPSFLHLSDFYVVPFVLLALWTGLAQPRWTYTRLLPLTTVALATPFVAADGVPIGLVIAVVLFVAPVCVALAEVTAWIMARLRSATVSLAATARELGESESRFRALVDASYDVTLITDQRGTITFVSANAEPDFGLAPSQLVGRSPLEVVHPDDHAALRAAFLRTVCSSESCRIGPLWLRVVHPETGVQRTVEVFTKSLLADETVKGIVVSARDITERQERETTLVHQADHDPLTHVLNRRALTARLEGMLAQGKARGAVVFLDLDRFKRVNDTHGHHVGDLVLIEVARRLTLCARAGDVIGRYGGDEFVMLVGEPSYPSEVEALASRMRTALSEPMRFDQVDATIGVSVGYSFIEAGDRRAEAVVRRADLAMYAVKEASRLVEVAKTTVAPGRLGYARP